MTTIQPLSTRPREIGVTEAIEPAYDRMKLILFQPFDLTKWILIGFCAWLAGLGEAGGGGGGGGYNGFNPNHLGRTNVGEQFREFYHKAADFLTANLEWIIPVAAAAALLMLAIWLLILWLNSRGKFMFLHCVAHNRAEVENPWSDFAETGNSLFRFRLVLGLISLVLMLPPLIIIAASVIRMILQGEPDAAGVVLCVGVGLAMFLVGLVFGLIHKFTNDFVVPIMFLRRGNCLAAWREFLNLLGAHPGKFTLYILFWIVLGMAIGALVVMVVLVTCCIAGCLLAIPFVGTVLFLPVLVFKRAYPLYYLAQYGPQYDVFPAPPAVPPLPGGGPT